MTTDKPPLGPYTIKMYNPLAAGLLTILLGAVVGTILGAILAAAGCCK